MKEIKISWAGLIPSLLWSWIIVWIPSMIVAFKIATTKYTVTGNQLTITTGLLNKKKEGIDLYRIKDISSNQSIFGYGNIHITDHNNVTYTLQYVADSNNVSSFIKDSAQSARKEQNIRVHEAL
ncbi:PH domain-containing protein [Listeria monocytogenes]|nr:PH domain-containing protein [Listeria monocytogenes]EAC9001942.1 PH domain-containing protein [Listeria monocytogenes]